MSADDEKHRVGAETPKGKKIGTLWDAAEATIVKSPEAILADTEEKMANKIA